ncbi:hypothetical protein OS133_21650, partial [Shewanella fidelis]
MAKVNLSKAAQLTGKNRTTIWRHIKSGKLSSERDSLDMPIVDTSELIRVYGSISLDATPTPDKKQHEATPSYLELVEIIKSLKEEQKEMKHQLTVLTNRLSYNP